MDARQNSRLSVVRNEQNLEKREQERRSNLGNLCLEFILEACMNACAAAAAGLLNVKKQAESVNFGFVNAKSLK